MALTEKERAWAMTTLTLSLMDARAARAVVDMMTPAQEEITRGLMEEAEARLVNRINVTEITR